MLPLEVVWPHSRKLRRERAQYEAQCCELLDLVGLKGFEKKSPWQLSGGMQQRVSLCRALIHHPELLMLDEPFAALDVFTREDLWGVLQNLWMARRPTVVLVTHDLRESDIFLPTASWVDDVASGPHRGRAAASSCRGRGPSM